MQIISEFRVPSFGTRKQDFKYKELVDLQVSAKTCPPSGMRVCVPNNLRLMFVG